ncbi:MAG: hypothetical protein ACK4TA_25355 [Saprospiraceae bacterium]
MRQFFLLALITITIVACNSAKKDVKSTTLNDPYLVFGKYFGHCLDECATLYKLEGNQLYADDMKRFNGWDSLEFKAEPLSDARYEAAKVLLSTFPQKLLNEAETIGCPDCADQGGFALEIRKDGKMRHWHIDTNKDQIPDYLRSYVEQLNTLVEQLKQ